MNASRESAHDLIDKVFDFVADVSASATVKLKVTDLTFEITIAADTPQAEKAQEAEAVTP